MTTDTHIAATDPAHTDTEIPRWQAGHVDWFDTQKGFGFLTPADGPAVFVDYGVIEVPGYKTLTAGQPVVYTAADTDRGPEATRVVPYPCPPARIDHHQRATPASRRWTRCRARAA